MNLDDDLHRAFRRKPAPPDLVDRVRTRIEQGDVSPSGKAAEVSSAEKEAAWRRIPVQWLAAAAVMALAATGGARYYVYQQTVAEAERVKAEIRLAFQITGEKLALAQRRVQE